MKLTDKAAIPSKVWGNKSAIENELRLAILTIAAICPKDLLEASPSYEKDHYKIIESGKSTFAVDEDKVFKKKFEAVTESNGKTPEQIANQQGWYKSIKSVDIKQFIKVEEKEANEDGWYIPGTPNIITEKQKTILDMINDPKLTHVEILYKNHEIEKIKLTSPKKVDVLSRIKENVINDGIQSINMKFKNGAIKYSEQTITHHL